MNDYGWDKSLNVKTMGRSDINEDYNHFAYEPTAYAVLLRLAERGYITKDNTPIISPPIVPINPTIDPTKKVTIINKAKIFHKT